jgi:hypothetical protein
LPVGKVGVGKTVTKGEERSDGGVVVVAVADVESFAVEDFEVFAGPVVVGWVVSEKFWEGGLKIISTNRAQKGGVDCAYREFTTWVSESE